MPRVRVKQKFYAEWLEQDFDGYAYPHLGDWNGWSIPFFEFDVASKIVERMGGTYDKETDTFTVPDREAGEVEEFYGEHCDLDGTKLYGIGAYSWIWEDSNQE